MEEILRKFPRRKIEEVLRQLSEGFGAALILLDKEGTPVARYGTACDDLECLTAGECRNGKTVSMETVNCQGNPIGSLAVCSFSLYGSEMAFGVTRCLENMLKLEGEIEDLSSEIVRLYEEISLLSSLSVTLGSEMDVDTICRLILDEADRVLSTRTIFIMLMDKRQQELYTRFSSGSDRIAALDFRADISTGLVAHVFSQGEPVTVCDITKDDRIRLPYLAEKILCVPLLSDSKPIGMLIATDKVSGEEFWSQELQLMRIFASEVASSIRKAQLYEEITKLFLSTVEALATAIDAKDPYTFGHSRRVARISVAICTELGMPRDRIRDVELASFFHDIGKIGTPESILQKPGLLSPEEYEKIKEHPAKGAEILSAIGEFREIITWIRHHHEKYDGTGYPDNIAAGDIPVESRILVIADAFDAMTTDRPYRKSLSRNEALKVMEHQVQKQFDPHIFQIFQRIVEQGKIL